ncbi:MAG: hypothetical protein HY914_02560 [Desulfomonile tiedjei]|nr:hypothetical protein [Desulfomonile tiedjei]
MIAKSGIDAPRKEALLRFRDINTPGSEEPRPSSKFTNGGAEGCRHPIFTVKVPQSVAVQ